MPCIKKVWKRCCNCSDPRTRPVSNNRPDESVSVIPMSQQPRSLYPKLYSTFYRTQQGQWNQGQPAYQLQQYPTAPRKSNLQDVVPTDSDKNKNQNQGATSDEALIPFDNTQKLISINEMLRMRVKQEK